MDETVPTKSAATPEWQPVLVYGVVLLALAITSVVFAAPGDGLLSGPYGAGTAVFFLVLGLFSIGTGFPHPAFGHVSFDRVAQVASILVLGPVDAAWVNGLASFMFPWHRLLKGVPLPAVATAAFHNAGLMIIVAGGWTDAADDQEAMALGRRWFAALEPYTGGYYDNIQWDGDKTVARNYGPNYARLSHIKGRYDPGNLFRMNSNIMPRG
jgi:hypothetical protein